MSNNIAISKALWLSVLVSFLVITGVAAQVPVRPVIDPQPVDPSKEITDAVKNLPTTTRGDWVEIFPQSNFRGKSARYAENVPNFTYPFSFSNKRGVSLKVAPGYIAYIAFKEDNAQEGIFIGDHGTFGTKYINDIKSIRVVPTTTVFINFCGFSTQIHNNDCKRVFGSVKIRFLEKMASGVLIPCPMTGQNGGGLRSSSPVYSPVLMYNKVNNYPQRAPMTFANLPLTRNIPDPDSYVINYDGREIPSMRNTLILPEGSAAGLTFTVSQQAMSENRIVVEFECDLGVHHKANDLASDYSSSVKMEGPETKRLDFQPITSFFSVGDFDLKGNPNNNHGMASGVKFSIIKKLRVHFNVETTPPKR